RLPVRTQARRLDLLLRLRAPLARTPDHQYDSDCPGVTSTFVTGPAVHNQRNLAHQRRFWEQCLSTTFSFDAIARPSSANTFRLRSRLFDSYGFCEIYKRWTERDAAPIPQFHARTPIGANDTDYRVRRVHEVAC